MNDRPDNWRERLAPHHAREEWPPNRAMNWGGKRTRVTREVNGLPKNAVMKGGQDARRRGGYPSRVAGRAERACRGDTGVGPTVASFINLKLR